MLKAINELSREQWEFGHTPPELVSLPALPLACHKPWKTVFTLRASVYTICAAGITRRVAVRLYKNSCKALSVVLDMEYILGKYFNGDNYQSVGR